MSSETVTWHHLGRDISTDEGARVHSVGKQLWFLPTSTEDSGNYTCFKHKYDPNTSETVRVTIQQHKQGICYYEDALYIETRGSPGSGNIPCPSFNSYKDASDIKWYKDCEFLQGSRYSMQNMRLYINNATLHDNGKYTCQFTYSHRGKRFNVSATRNFAILDYPWPKSIQVCYPKDNGSIEVEIGSPANLSCKAWLGIGKLADHGSYWENNSEEDPNRFVRFNKSYLKTGEGYYTEAVLNIMEVRKEDLNLTFSCSIWNIQEFKRVSITLRDKEKGHSNIYLIVGFFILLAILNVMVILYRFFRVDVVLWYQRIFNCIGSKNDGKIYDAYVIYPTNHINGISENNFMSDFVHQILPEVLENQCGYQLCIYGRDVLPGEDAVDAVERRIKQSRRLIIPLTQSQAMSKDFSYEHQIALYNALIQNDVKVILLEMERIGDYATFQESLRHIINQQGTVKWKEKYMACPFSPNSAFWKHVKYQMPPIHKWKTVDYIECNSL
ncbi:interleukin-1 receptor-like 1 [Hemicordylus capensis]|uniref:interleukin-1 receptor-like 1 n=1 Tax=Hemicordylus capensis TaxID=884348 RepID=UPI0023030671|nr:interleukin-1 receptor-like 1 [Hemicordylus capensis]